jgi:hypothetical protein
MSGALLASFGLTNLQFENKAKEYLGVPYHKGGVSRRGMDCSGFARVLYDKLFNIELPHNSIDQFQFSGLQEISSKKMQPGDLVFFANRKQKSINHVGVYLSNGKFIHASMSQGINVSKLSDSYWKKRFVGCKRYMTDNIGANRAQLQPATSVAIPVSDNGLLTGSVHDNFWSHSTATLQNALSAMLDDQVAFSLFDSNSHNFCSIGDNHSIIDAFNVHFTAIREIFCIFALYSREDFRPDAK